MSKKLFLPLVMAVLVVMGAIGSVHAATCNGTFTGLTPNLANGQALVAANGNCASCHAVPTGASAATIYSFASQMSFMSSWGCQNYVDVAAALASTPPPPSAACNGTFTGLTPNLANGQALVAAKGN